MAKAAAKPARLTYRPAEVAQKLGVSRWMVDRMIRDGELDTVPVPGGGLRAPVLITAASLNRFLEDNQRTAGGGAA